MSDFYKGIALEKEVRNGKEVFILVIKVNDILEERVILKADQLEHIISQYRIVK